jgi:hypothetical protein
MAEKTLQRWVSGPLTGNPHGKLIAKAVLRGQRVQDGTDAGIAVAYGHWFERRCLIALVLFALLGLVNLVLVVIHPKGSGIATTSSLLIFFVLYGFIWLRTRRSIQLNNGTPRAD